MPIPKFLNMMKFLKTDGESGVCPVCAMRMSHISDGDKYLDKCLRCGYSYVPQGDITEQRRHDYRITIVQAALQKKGYYELSRPIEEILFNELITAGRSVDEAVTEMAKDLDLSAEDIKYFKEKLNFMG